MAPGSSCGPYQLPIALDLHNPVHVVYLPEDPILNGECDRLAVDPHRLLYIGVYPLASLYECCVHL